jgi:hypothetical protein
MRMRPWLLIPVLALAGCADLGGRGVVIPDEGGRLVATASARTEQEALRDALAAARAECSGRRQSLAVVRERTEYRGVVAREIVRTAEQIEEIIAAGSGKVVPDLSSDEDYKVSVDFRCT